MAQKTLAVVFTDTTHCAPIDDTTWAQLPIYAQYVCCKGCRINDLCHFNVSKEFHRRRKREHYSVAMGYRWLITNKILPEALLRNATGDVAKNVVNSVS